MSLTENYHKWVKELPEAAREAHEWWRNMMNFAIAARISHVENVTKRQTSEADVSASAYAIILFAMVCLHRVADKARAMAMASEAYDIAKENFEKLYPADNRSAN